MPKNKERSAFFSKVKKNTKATWKKARKVKPTPIGQGLPPNLKNAVAVFSEYKLAESKKGDPYVSLTGIVVEPENCVGRRVTRTYYLADGPYATADQNLEKLAREAKLMGAEGLDESSEEDWPDIFEEMVASKSKFLFHTGEYNGKTTIQIQGVVDDDNHESSDDEEVVDDEKDEESDDDETTEAPEVGDAVMYKPPRKKAAMEMAVTEVDEDEQTVCLVDDNDKSYKDVPWSKIEFVEE